MTDKQKKPLRVLGKLSNKKRQKKKLTNVNLGLTPGFWFLGLGLWGLGPGLDNFKKFSFPFLCQSGNNLNA